MNKKTKGAMPLQDGETQDIKAVKKVCNRCKKDIGAKDLKCPHCLAPTTWER